MKNTLVAFSCGLLFAIGLSVAGMTRPSKIIAFLDVTGDWDPSLALVMVGAIAVYAVAHRLSLHRSKPLLAEAFERPRRTDIDFRLVAGAVVFGIGWGASGYCPGPVVVSLGAASLPALWVAGGMVAGMLAFSALETRTAR